MGGASRRGIPCVAVIQIVCGKILVDPSTEETGSAERAEDIGKQKVTSLVL